MSTKIIRPNYWINCEYCGAPVECVRHKHGGRTRRKYCDDYCARRMEALRREEREQHTGTTQEVA